jgi:hypothetical protein
MIICFRDFAQFLAILPNFGTFGQILGDFWQIFGDYGQILGDFTKFRPFFGGKN